MIPGELHPQVRAFLARPAVEPWSMPLAEIRAAEHEASAAIPAGPQLAAVGPLTIPTRAGGLEGRLYEPDGARGTIVWLHGGGWVVGDLETVDAMCRLLAQASGARVVSVDYRLAPEHPFPAAPDDAGDALRSLVAAYAPEPAVVGGDSAGGNLAAVCAARMRGWDAALGASLVAQVLVYPALDPAMDTTSWQTYGGPEFNLSREEMAGYWERYLRGGADPADPAVSPPRGARLTGLAPAIVVIAGLDPLSDEGLAYAHALDEAGVEVEIDVYDDMIHGFFSRPGLFDAGTEAVQRVGRGLAARIQDADGRRPAR